jgi:alpha-beta hydrolase superfamily lysophospholipase
VDEAAKTGDFIVGTREFHREPNMNYQFNRVWALCGGDLEEVRSVAGKVKSLDDWSEAFLALARKAEAEGRMKNSAAYHRAANFYLAPDDPRKRACYETYSSMVRDSLRGQFESGAIEEAQVPYGPGFLPVWRMRPATGAPAVEGSNVIVFHLGYDSLKEELQPVMGLFSQAGFDTYLFEGPGQGEALYRHGIAMTHEWEKPVKAVLDFLALDDVTLVGLSLGGYLAPRAAAFEPRVKRVVAWGVLYDFFGTVVSRRGKGLEAFLRTAVRMRAKALVNAVIRRKMASDTFTRWGVEHGMSVFGVGTPFKYFEELLKYTMKDISPLVTQDFLLLGSSEDHFIPRGDFARQADALGAARSLTARMFTASEQAGSHVQFGNLPLASRVICDWIRERLES